MSLGAAAMEPSAGRGTMGTDRWVDVGASGDMHQLVEGDNEENVTGDIAGPYPQRNEFEKGAKGDEKFKKATKEHEANLKSLQAKRQNQPYAKQMRTPWIRNSFECSGDGDRDEANEAKKKKLTCESATDVSSCFRNERSAVDGGAEINEKRFTRCKWTLKKESRNKLNNYQKDRTAGTSAMERKNAEYRFRQATCLWRRKEDPRWEKIKMYARVVHNQCFQYVKYNKAGKKTQDTCADSEADMVSSDVMGLNQMRMAHDFDTPETQMSISKCAVVGHWQSESDCRNTVSDFDVLAKKIRETAARALKSAKKPENSVIDEALAGIQNLFGPSDKRNGKYQWPNDVSHCGEEQEEIPNSGFWN